MFSGRCARRTRLEPTTTESQQSSRPTAVLEKPTSESLSLFSSCRCSICLPLCTHIGLLKFGSQTDVAGGLQNISRGSTVIYKISFKNTYILLYYSRHVVLDIFSWTQVQLFVTELSPFVLIYFRTCQTQMVS